VKEDRYSNDLEGAAGWQAYHGDHFEDDDRPTAADCDDDCDDDADRCGCSDPGCPCEGPKRGTP
jgi:hypothetical protein